MLVVIEGLDGAGKSTQVKKLKTYLSEKSSDLKYLHFPRYDAPVVGEMVSKFLRGDYGSIESVHPQIVALLFAEDRRDASILVRRWLQQGDIVLFDRYVYSNIAFQCAKLNDIKAKNELKDWILNTEYNEFKIPKPDVNIFLDVPISFVRERLNENRRGHDRDYLQGKDDIHEADINFQIKVREMYLSLCDQDENFIKVDCSDNNGNILSPGLIFEKIKDVVDSIK